MQRALVVLVLSAVACAAQDITFTDKFIAMRNGTFQPQPVVVPACQSGSDTNCWVQTGGAPAVVITGYAVINAQEKFPCNDGGSTQSQFSFETTTSLEEADCQSTCQGFGCTNRVIKLCEGFGVNPCPHPAGTFTGTGYATKCTNGLGDYTLTITCPKFELTTYVTY